MSSLWCAVVLERDEQKTYMLKRAGESESHRRRFTQEQSEILQSIAESCKGLADFQSLYVGFDMESGLLILEKSELPALNTYLKGIPIFQAAQGFPELIAGARLAGRWLKRWHAATTKTGNSSTGLSRYVHAGTRSEGLAILPSEYRQTLIEAVENFPDGQVVRTHGDYTAFNVLTDGIKISIIDPGVLEWRYIDPCWDICTFTNSIEEQMTKLRGSAILAPKKVINRVKQGFLDGYGSPEIQHSPSFLICSAVRSFIRFWSERGEASAKYNLDRLADQLTALRLLQ